jgi:wyosine [tRNA(Phe)-imidazoG37] synthetase (radical SAM superfamily)
MNEQKLTIIDHTRYFNDCVYVYPVLSRRAKGVSLGINLNLNNTCNWKCIYCQVEGLHRGKPEQINLELLKQELSKMLEWIVNGDFLAQFAPDGMQRLNDICMAGNGEPTLSPNFVEVCELIAKLRNQFNISDDVKTVLITNGSHASHEKTQQGFKILNEINGEIWFKIDRINPESINATNQVNLSRDIISKNLITTSKQCKTLVQSCWFANSGASPSEQEMLDFTDFIIEHKAYITKVLLYSVARPTAQAEGKNIRQFSENEFDFITNIFDENKIYYSVSP